MALYPKGGAVAATELRFLEVDFDRETDRLSQPAAREVLSEEGELLSPYETFRLRDLKAGGVETGAGTSMPVEDLALLGFPQRPRLNAADGGITLSDRILKAEPDKLVLSEQLKGQIQQSLGGLVAQDCVLVAGQGSLAVGRDSIAQVQRALKHTVYRFSEIEGKLPLRRLTPTLPVLIGCSANPRQLPRSAVLKLRLAAAIPTSWGLTPSRRR